MWKRIGKIFMESVTRLAAPMSLPYHFGLRVRHRLTINRPEWFLISQQQIAKGD